MKKLLLSSLVLLLMTTISFAQTIVSTAAEDRNVILEEFTGINCTFCPDGHAIANAIKDQNPDDVFLINIHAGSFANPGSGQPDFRTPFGQAIADQSGLVGYPAGTVNRQIFPGASQSGNPDDTGMSRGQWAAAAGEVLLLPSYLNMAVEADIDVQTREITVHVESYYTGDSPEASNLLNVALLQNNTLGPQTGGNMGDNYVHQHRLVHMITGQWGDPVTTTTANTFVDRTYTYTIPTDYNNIDVELGELELVVFMTETQQFIISGNGTTPTFSNFEFDNDANLQSISDIADVCENSITPIIKVQNNGGNEITSLDIEYATNGDTPQTFNWTGSIGQLQSQDIELPSIGVALADTNTLDVTISADDNVDNNESSTAFDRAPFSAGLIEMELNTDNWGSEVSWSVVESDGTVVYSGGPYGNNITVNETFELDLGCHTFNINDAFGDGGGAITLTDLYGEVIYSTPGNYGSGESQNFDSDGVLRTEEVNLINVSVYPNPATTAVNVTNAVGKDLLIYDILGKVVYSKNNISNDEVVNVSQLTTGTYFVKIAQGENSLVEKLIISRK